MYVGLFFLSWNEKNNGIRKSMSTKVKKKQTKHTPAKMEHYLIKKKYRLGNIFFCAIKLVQN
jgi:hypothetical protein